MLFAVPIGNQILKSTRMLFVSVHTYFADLLLYP